MLDLGNPESQFDAYLRESRPFWRLRGGSLQAILMRICVSRAPFPAIGRHPADHFDAYLRESRPFWWLRVAP